MTLFQILMFIASGYFAFRIYEHIQTLQDPQNFENNEDVATASPNVQMLIDIADEEYKNNNFKKSLELLEEANSKQRYDSEILFKLGFVSQKLKKSDDALRYFNQALEIDDKNEYIHNAIASLYRANNEYASAKTHLNESLAINDKNPITYYNYGNLLVDMKHFEEAKAMYKKALDIDSDFTEAKEELHKLEAKNENISNL